MTQKRIDKRWLIFALAFFWAIFTVSTTKGQNNKTARENIGIGPVILGPDSKPAPASIPPPVPISLEDAIQLLYTNNSDIKIAEKSVEIAKAEKQKLNSLWYPHITATGSYMHFSNDIEAKEELGEILKPLENIIDKYIPIQGELGDFINKLNGITLSFPILKQNISTFDATATWPLFTGGKRIWANRIGKSLIASAQGIQKLTNNTQLAILIETYYTLKLSREVVKEREENVNSMMMLYNNAMSLMRNGMINKAEMLVAQVAMEEAIRELENAREEAGVAENALKTILGIKEYPQSGALNPSSDFFIIKTLPPIDYYHNLISNDNNQLKILQEQQNIVENEKKIAKSEYLPNIAIFAKQTVYSYQIPSNLSPRTVVGAGMVWNIFDGLNREKTIGISKKNYEQLQMSKDKAQNDLFLLAHKLRSQMMDALYNIRALESTTELCQELLTVREKSFKEGMANSFDVVSARATLSKAKLATLMAYWQFDTALANLTAICGDSEEFIQLYKNSKNELQ